MNTKSRILKQYLALSREKKFWIEVMGYLSEEMKNSGITKKGTEHVDVDKLKGNRMGRLLVKEYAMALNLWEKRRREWFAKKDEGLKQGISNEELNSAEVKQENSDLMKKIRIRAKNYANLQVLGLNYIDRRDKPSVVRTPVGTFVTKEAVQELLNGISHSSQREANALWRAVVALNPGIIVRLANEAKSAKSIRSPAKSRSRRSKVVRHP